MSDFPARIHITEEGPREGFQFEKGDIPAARKVELIDALAETGIRQIQAVSFVSPKAVPQMADAEAVLAGIAPRDGVEFTALWLNLQGLERAIAAPKLTLDGSIGLTAPETFLARNQKRTMAENLAQQRAMAAVYKAAGIPVSSGSVMAAFGCNFEGPIPVDWVVGLVGDILAVAEERGDRIELMNFSDTMGWATPRGVKAVVGAVRDRYPDLPLALHLHDTRGMGHRQRLCPPRASAASAGRCAAAISAPTACRGRSSGSWRRGRTCSRRSRTAPASTTSRPASSSTSPAASPRRGCRSSRTSRTTPRAASR